MATFNPRSPYSQAELDRLYPAHLELQLVQVLLRHGERVPVSTRFQNAGLAPYWPYCNAAQRLRSVAMTPTEKDSQWNSLQWRRRLERFGDDDGPIIAAGPNGETDGICNLGELTDKGRLTTHDLGSRLRHLYIDQLKFMPALLSSADSIYLRATPMPRALESVQQTFWGMYPLTARTASFPPPTIVTRTPADETLFPNDSNCRRYAQLSRAFAQRTAERWNGTEDMKYLNSLVGKWMPEGSPEVKVDGHPRLSGIMDTINSTLSHGPETRLPKEFYDEKGRAIIDKIGVEEWFSGYAENREYRKLGIGGLVGDIVQRMCALVEGSGLSINEVGGENGRLGKGRGGEEKIKFAMSGCHDTTLAAVLTSLGAFEGENWPPYTSHIAVEMFRRKGEAEPTPPTVMGTPSSGTERQAEASKPGWLAGLLGLGNSKVPSAISTIKNPGKGSGGIGRRAYSDLSSFEKEKLDAYYVRLRYNDKVMTVPGCKAQGKHLEGDETFCTLEAFKRVADGFVPMNWKRECGMNLDRNGSDVRPVDQAEWAGQIEEGS